MKIEKCVLQIICGHTLFVLFKKNPYFCMRNNIINRTSLNLLIVHL